MTINAWYRRCPRRCRPGTLLGRGWSRARTHLSYVRHESGAGGHRKPWSSRVDKGQPQTSGRLLGRDPGRCERRGTRRRSRWVRNRWRSLRHLTPARR